MSDCGNNNSKDCEECQKTLKDHLKQCADYGKNPALIEKCSDLPGGCSAGKPESCPCPPPKEETCPPPPSTCNTPTTTFTCPASSCDAKAACPPPKEDPCPPKDASPPKNPCEIKLNCCPPPSTKVEQCPAKKAGADVCGGSKPVNDNSCEVKPLSMDK